MSCGVGHRCSSDLVLLWLWCRSVAVAPISSLAWEHPYAEIKQPVDQWGNQKGNLKMPRDKWYWKHNHSKSMGCHKSSSWREVHSNTGLLQKGRKISNQQLNLPSKRIRKEEQAKPKVSRRKEIIKKQGNPSTSHVVQWGKKVCWEK